MITSKSSEAPSGNEEATPKADPKNETKGSSRKPPFNEGDWRSRIITDDEPPEWEVLLRIGDVPIVTRGNYTVITGKKKSRKSLLGAWLIGQINGKVLIFDTEQSPWHVWQLRKRILHTKTDDGECIVVYLRGLPIKEKKRFIEEALSENPDVVAVLIDNVRDLLTNINDSEIAQVISEFLESLTSKYNIGLLCTIHTNKSDDKIRGHIGAELENKAYMVMKVRRCTAQSEVECESSRDGDFPTFILRHQDVTGMPEVLDVPVTEEDKRKAFCEILSKGVLPFGKLLKDTRDRLGSGGLIFPEQKAREEIKNALDKGWIVKTGKDNSPSARYGLKPPDPGPVA